MDYSWSPTCTFSWCCWHTAAAAAAKSLQSCLTLCNPIDSSSLGSPFPGILQARTLEWVAISFSKAWKSKVKLKSLSRVRHLATPWAAAYQASPSMGFSRQEYWSGVPSKDKNTSQEVIGPLTQKTSLYSDQPLIVWIGWSQCESKSKDKSEASHSSRLL